jgi:tetratricopeptide (TPR) repeat protein
VKPVPDEKAFEFARQAVRMTNESSAYSIHTLATLYAQAGRLTDALETLTKSYNMDPRMDPREEDYYVLGLIAQSLGFIDGAKEAYEKVKPGDSVFYEVYGNSTYDLVQKRLEELNR